MSYQQSGADAVDNEEVKTHGNDDGPHSSAIFDPKMTEYEFPKEPSPADYALHPIRYTHGFFAKLSVNFGFNFVLMMAVAYVLIKGSLHGILGLVKLSYCKKTLKIDGTQCQTLDTIARTPWSMKGVIGVVSDWFPFLGYHKASYIIASAALGTVAATALGLWPVPLVPVLAALLLMVVNLEIATTDLLCEGRYSALMRRLPQSGSSMVSFVWGCIMAGSLASACVVGPVADNFDPQVLFLVCIPLAASVAAPAALGWLREEPAATADAAALWERLRRHWQPTVLCLLTAAVALGNAVVALFFFDDHTIQLAFCSCGAATVAVLSLVWLPREMAQCNVYMMLAHALYLGLSGAMDFWYTADEACVPGGPAFDYTYYNTYTAVVGSLMAWVGVVMFEALLAGWTFRSVFWIITLMQVTASLCDVIMMKRWNLALGISDHAFYMLGDAVVGPAIGSMAFMPSMVLISKLATKGLESTTFALLAGFANFGNTVASQGVHIRLPRQHRRRPGCSSSGRPTRRSAAVRGPFHRRARCRRMRRGAAEYRP